MRGCVSGFKKENSQIKRKDVCDSEKITYRRAGPFIVGIFMLRCVSGAVYV